MALTFPKDCAFSAGDLVAMISALLDEQAEKTVLYPGTRIQADAYSWGTLELFCHLDGEHILHNPWGRIHSVHEPALSWGAIESPSQ